jgi:transposase InsO family protein
MPRTTPEQRQLMAKAVKKGNNKNVVAKVFDVCVKTVSRWCKRDKKPGPKCFKDKPRKPKESKVTLEVELTILSLRNTFNFGTGRIQQGLINLPPYMRIVLPFCVQGVFLSRSTINDVLKKHKLNGYKNKTKSWKFFRAKKPNELWQLDIKGPFRVEGEKYWFVVCIDDYSRYLLLAEQLKHDPTVEEIEEMLIPYVRKHKPKNILTDNKPFKTEWDKWCKANSIEPLHAHPYYPQDKGKVERAIRNVAEEFIYLLTKFKQWLDGKIKNYKRWFNYKRFHRGINNYPAKLFWGC